MGTKEALKKKKMRKSEGISLESRDISENDKKSNTAKVATNKDRSSEKKRKRKKEQNIGVGETVQLHTQDSPVRVEKKKKRVKNAENNSASIGFSSQLDNETDDGLDNETDDGLNQQNGRSKKGRKEKAQSSKGGEKAVNKKEADSTEICHVPSVVESSLKRKKGKSKGAKKKKNNHDLSKDTKSQEEEGASEDDVYLISSGDEDSSKGMKKWISEYHQSRPGIPILQQRIDEFITAHEEKLEQEKKEREERAAEGGWTVVTHHKGRKKTTEAETGVTVGSVAQATVKDKLEKKKSKQVGLDFYRFQKKEAHRNDIMALQSKFKEDMTKLQQLRAARKFRPY